jgi:single-strand DNA-binding protein
MARSLNKATLIGNLTRDPELRYTPQGTAVCTFGIATNRQWTTDSGEKREDTEFHRIVAWNKLAELCSQLLSKGRKVYLEGRIQTRDWTAQDGTQRRTTEVVISDMIILDSRRDFQKAGLADIPESEISDIETEPDEMEKAPSVKTKKEKPAKATKKKKKAAATKKSKSSKKGKKKTSSKSKKKDEEVEDIPF